MAPKTLQDVKDGIGEFVFLFSGSDPYKLHSIKRTTMESDGLTTIT